MRQRILVSIGSIALIAMLVVGVTMMLNPLRRSEATIRAHLLEEAPLGSSMDHVLGVIRRHKWDLSYINTKTGFYDERTRPAHETGVQSVRASLGDYYDFPWMANVTVLWGFDSKGKLIDFWVWKTWDGI